MMRVAHFSDLHYAGATLTEVDRCFSFAVDQAIARGVDCAVISGDSTDHALEVHAPAVEALARNIRRLADYCPVLMLHGTFSHEPPGYRGAEYEVTLVPKVKIEAAIPDNLLDKVIEALGRAAKTGKIGDGKIFVSVLEQAIRVRTGDKNDAAL